MIAIIKNEMRNRFFLSLIIATLTTSINAQHLAVPDSILNELHTIKISTDTILKDSLFFKVVYPVNYDSTKTYPVLLGLSGGDQKEVIVDYCYAAWFKSNYFDNYITILPVCDSSKNLLYYDSDDINNMLNTIKDNFRVTTKDWIIVGTSNGGRAAFNFIAEDPELFEGGIVIPGVIEDSVEINDSWKDLTIVLAYGDKDEDDWIKGAEKTKNRLSTYVKNVQTIILKEQGHILLIDFDIDIIYKKYFDQN